MLPQGTQPSLISMVFYEVDHTHRASGVSLSRCSANDITPVLNNHLFSITLHPIRVPASHRQFWDAWGVFRLQGGSPRFASIQARAKGTLGSGYSSGRHHFGKRCKNGSERKTTGKTCTAQTQAADPIHYLQPWKANESSRARRFTPHTACINASRISYS